SRIAWVPIRIWVFPAASRSSKSFLEDPVEFKNLGLAITDEQHRFGVAQRARLWKKSKPFPPHVLVMTATPIPRTLAMTLYGDLDVSVIDELPPGRKPVETQHRTEAHRMPVFGFMREEIAKGRQIYVVYPLIEESEKLDLNNLQQGYEAMSREFPRPQYQISIVHGRMKPADKDFEMQRFVRGETQIMVATTVIEVGVNVPNASVMVIENTERFGLSQLHQLRGRVGRGAEQSYCILMTGYKLSEEGRQRIDTMVRTNNGFEIAEADLRLRGPGNIQGTQQSGMVQLRIADLAQDTAILQTAREVAKRILEMDPQLADPRHASMKKYLKESGNNYQSWSRIS
ncbi:MAG: helicase-related protein, partial [Bacteroidota bacterium]